MNKPDENEDAARIVREMAESDEGLPPEMEAAWVAWSAGIQNVDERTMSLLRAAFEAGYSASSDS